MELNNVKAFCNYTEAIFLTKIIIIKNHHRRKKTGAEEHKGQAGNRNKRKIFFRIAFLEFIIIVQNFVRFWLFKICSFEITFFKNKLK